MSKDTKFGSDIATNRKAYHDYDIIDTIEAGIVLKGTEIKSIRARKVNLKDSFVLIRDGEATVRNLHISPWNFGNIFNHEATRNRKLLLHRKEIDKLDGFASQKGMSIIPLKIYIKKKYAKILLGLAKGKKKFDKRAALKEKDIKRDMDRELKNFK